jgi:hypothetical protein
MEVLAARLSKLDSEAEGAIRVVMFYDTLMRRRVDLPALARASAGLAECVAGIRLHGTGQVLRMSPDGMAATLPPRPPPATAPMTLDEEEIGAVWLERPGQPFSLDELLLERLAHRRHSGRREVWAGSNNHGRPSSCRTGDQLRQ